MVLLEGIEPSTGNTLQARHSYRLAADGDGDGGAAAAGGGGGGLVDADVAWNARPARCVFWDGVGKGGTEGGGVRVDFGLFHGVVHDVPEDGGSLTPPPASSSFTATDSHA